MVTRIRKEAVLPDSLRISFLGDSITDNGLYIAYLDAYFRYHHPATGITFINLGVSSETASGLSEPEHPFPRPCVHDRLARALEESRPDRVVLCYGMNDGIYHPFANERFQAYKDGMSRAIQAVKQAGAKAIVLTPPPFDAKSKPQGSEPVSSYSWKTPYAKYNEVLGRYADWIMTLTSETEAVVNIYEPLWTEICAAEQHGEPGLTGDGIHPNARGHWIIAKTLLNSLFDADPEAMPDYMEDADPPAWFSLTLQRHRLLSSAWKEHVGHTNPNKSQALPLEAALVRGGQLAEEIRGLLQTGKRTNDAFRKE
ncbi:SGNH/GDSL hydrolase family protein [Paenibacillus allorhizosphaerae]|uniref:SGNH hydrolase-type esterase domain-containing protein n=1 Tax=Paenibacillus allorhizosphaerae TaxID=2849866 RepID=A0ABN7TIZ6_9BACL|nr:SGNH/GDSL hydrolase family protein [Paenibacillus allorhizosphaerae]CAG7635089.1 hypothetical protein PAECIP111802_02097 [Paenibacillus allorhizosphaerae]